MNLSSVGSHVVPTHNELFDLGHNSLRWRDLYLSGNTIDLGGTAIKSTEAGVSFTSAANANVAVALAVSSVQIGTGANAVTLVSGASGLQITSTASNVATPISGGGATVTVSNTTPATNSVGSLWLDDDTGELRIFYGNSWAGVAYGPIGATGPAGSNGATGATGAFSGTTSSQIITTNSTAATSTSTGALQVTGGAGIGGAVYAGSVYTNNYFFANGTAFVGGGGSAGYDVATSSTGYFDLPSGNTAQRPASPPTGAVRYNSTTGFAEVYIANGWQSFGFLPPSISTVTPSTYTGAAGTTFTINGAGFTSDAIVRFVDNAGTEYTAGTVVYISQSQLTATTPQIFTVAQEPLDVKVMQLSGQITKLDCIDCGGTPNWNTASGSLGTVSDQETVSLSVSATDPDGSSIIYNIESGSLPGGVSLNSSSGLLSGNPTDLANSTTYNFTVGATDNAGNKTTRSFSIYVLAENPNVIVPGVTAWYDFTSWNNTTKIWSDKINSNHTSAGSAGITTATVAANSAGASKAIQCMQGGTGESLYWPSNILPSTYTLFHVTRYSGLGSRERIYTNGSTGNWLSGHWSGKSGVAYHEGWLTQASSSIHGDNWVLSSDQNSLYRSNGVQRGTGGGGYNRLSINNNEQSAWQTVEVIVYSSTLDATQIGKIESYLSVKYGITLG